MMLGALSLSGWVTAAALVALAAATGDDQFTKDKQECGPQLAVLSPCLSYVGGNAKTPTMDCCTNLKQVLTTSKKCICLLVKYRNQPGLRVKIDANLALGLPAVCHSTPIYDCLALLHLVPNPPDAKVFTDFYKAQNASTATAPSAPVTVTDSKANKGGQSTKHLESRAVFLGIMVLFFFFLLS